MYLAGHYVSYPSRDVQDFYLIPTPMAPQCLPAHPQLRQETRFVLLFGLHEKGTVAIKMKYRPQQL